MERIVFELGLVPAVLLSAVLGFAIGFERKWRSKEAGVRTHTIISIGTALITVISIYGFGALWDADAARVAAQIVPGIGFLGAGIIVYRQHEVKGLTTAAGVLATAGVGMACGCGMYVLAVVATVIIVAAQFILHMNIKPFQVKRTFSVHIEFSQVDGASIKIKELFGVSRFNDLTIKREGDAVLYSATLHTSKELSSLELDTIIQEHPFISSITRCENT